MGARKQRTHGGARPGAGRKPLFREAARMTFDLEGTEIDALRKLAERREVAVAELVRAAIRAYLQRQKR